MNTLRLRVCRALSLGLLATTLGACANSGEPMSADTPTLNSEAILLVSRADGSVVRQTVGVAAEICMKSAGASRTRCFVRGAPLYNDVGELIGHEMNELELDLYAAAHQ